MDESFNENHQPAGRRRSRQRSLQSTLDKLLGIKQSSQENQSPDQSIREEKDEIHSPLQDYVHNMTVDVVETALRDSSRSPEKIDFSRRNSENEEFRSRQRESPSRDHLHSPRDRRISSPIPPARRESIPENQNRRRWSIASDKTDHRIVPTPTASRRNSFLTEHVHTRKLSDQSEESIGLPDDQPISAKESPRKISLEENKAKVAMFRKDSDSKIQQRRRSSASSLGNRDGPEKISTATIIPLRISKDSPQPIKKSLYKRPVMSVSLMNINNPALMRKSAYQDWLKKKDVVMAERRKQEMHKKEQEKAKMKEKDIKKQEAISTYTSWKKTKDEQLGRQIRMKKKKASEKEKEEKEKNEEKLKDAEKIFKSWKKDKDETRRTVDRERHKSESAKLEKKKEDERQKKVDAVKVFDEWKRKKDTEITSFVRLLKKAERQHNQQHFATQIERDLEAQKQFELWLERKERERVDRAMLAISPSPGSKGGSPKNEIYGSQNFRPPWIPSNPTVPKTAKLGQRRGYGRSRSAGGRR